MKKLIVILVFAVTLLVQNEIVRGDEPYLRLSTEPDKLEFRVVPTLTGDEICASLTVYVESNCVHGAILASITPLKLRGRGLIIPKERISIQAPTTVGYVAMSKPVVISRTTMGSHDMVLNFKAETSFEDFAGTYQGMIAFTVMPP